MIQPHAAARPGGFREREGQMARDMTKARFRSALERHGIKPDRFGYYLLSDGKTLVYARNGGDSRREQLAYLLRVHRSGARRGRKPLS